MKNHCLCPSMNTDGIISSQSAPEKVLNPRFSAPELDIAEIYALTTITVRLTTLPKLVIIIFRLPVTLFFLAISVIGFLYIFISSPIVNKDDKTAKICNTTTKNMKMKYRANAGILCPKNEGSRFQADCSSGVVMTKRLFSSPFLKNRTNTTQM